MPADLDAIEKRCEAHGPTDGDIAGFAAEAHADRIALMGHVGEMSKAMLNLMTTGLEYASKLEHERLALARVVAEMLPYDTHNWTEEIGDLAERVVAEADGRAGRIVAAANGGRDG